MASFRETFQTNRRHGTRGQRRARLVQFHGRVRLVVHHMLPNGIVATKGFRSKRGTRLTVNALCCVLCVLQYIIESTQCVRGEG